ncbi:hypothetical protein ILUMI_25723 [Ignelater luminosus]|uniref:RHD domain-containing protein n=1 Tax=Ignelater luminosus TaxID=2038154 RepID=A0A8K0C4H6_IGNLU|nr:hypothetical protein ILUMI_25723 [Ignelater luminosus]
MYQINVNTNTIQMNNNFVDKHKLVETTVDSMSNYPFVLTPPMDSPDSNMRSPPSGSNSPSHTYIPQGVCQPLYTFPIPMDQTQGFAPYLTMGEEPVERFRFRYKSEMAGTHGSLTGKNSDRSRKQTYPTVELHNYDKPAVVRCSLYQYSREEMIHTRQPHAHRLVRKQGSEEIDDPHDIHVNPDSGYVATFHSMGIIHTAKKYIVSELEKKNKKLKLEDVARNERVCRPLSKKEEQEIRSTAEKESKSINLNIVCLRFEAFKVINNIYFPLCPPIYSSSINNLKSALTGDLKIVRMDHFTSPSRGGKEIFILVEKVTKKNIKVRFYELDDEDNEIWSDYGRFTDLDVHHQYAIVFKTPPYKVLDIESEVKVFIELQRPSDGARSEPKDFTYTPSKIIHNRKRPRFTSSSYSSSNFSSDELPLTINNLPDTQEYNFPRPVGQTFVGPNLVVNSEELNEALRHDKINSAEFEKLCNSLITSEPIQDLYADLTAEDLRSLVMDAPKMIDKKPVFMLNTQLPSAHYGCTSRSLRNLNSEEQKIVTKFKDELVAFVKTNPPKNRMAMMLENLFENSAYISENMETTLHMLVSENNQTYLPFLLKLLFKYQQTALINMRNRKGQTALHLAVECHNLSAVDHLLYTKANIAIQDLEGNTVFHVAVIGNAPLEILKLLCMVTDEHGCIDTINYEGLTALHLAVKSNNIAATKMLCWRKADINAEDKKTGDTVLHVAVVDQRLEIVKFLLENPDVNLEKENYAQYSPFKLARLLLQKEVPVTEQIYELLENYMRKKGSFQLVVDIKEEMEELSEEEMDIVSERLKKEQPMSPDDLREKYSQVTTFTEDCLNEVSDILDKSGTWHNLAELLDYGHLLRTNIFASSKNLLQFAMKKEESIFEIRNFLENLDEFEAVDCIDNMVNKLVL